MNYSVIRKLLFCLPAEFAHTLSLNAIKYCWPQQNIQGQPRKVMGIDFPNQVGLAAGLDKNGDYIEALAKLGFGHIEIGTITPKPQPGNDKPRLFRLPEHQALINRLGFNNKGVDYLVEQVKQSQFDGVLGINIGKNAATPMENAIDDYVTCFKKVYEHADYITVNVSSPNTAQLRSLQGPEALSAMINALQKERSKLKEAHGYKPIAVKIAPDLIDKELSEMANIFLATKIDAVIATNTTLSRDIVCYHLHAHKMGGISGMPLTEKSLIITQKLAKILQNQIPVISVGGIMSADDAQARLQAGASLVQVYTGLIYQGPDLIKNIIQTSL